MAHDVFISYSSTDKPVADSICASLEGRKIRCWIAPRDIVPGNEYAGSITEAVKASRVLVLVFSASANNSPHVMRELERAVSSGIPIIPFRVENVAVSKSMEYYICTSHWLDAMTPPLEQHLQHLGQTVALLLAESVGGCASHSTTTPSGVSPISPPEDKRAPLSDAERRIWRELGRQVMLPIERKATGHHMRQNWDEAMKNYREIERIAREFGDDERLAWCLQLQATVLKNRAQFSEALVLYGEAIRIFRDLADNKSLALTLFEQGELLDLIRRGPEALPIFEEAHRLAESSDLQAWKETMKNRLAAARAKYGASA